MPIASVAGTRFRARPCIPGRRRATSSVASGSSALELPRPRREPPAHGALLVACERPAGCLGRRRSGPSRPWPRLRAVGCRRCGWLGDLRPGLELGERLRGRRLRGSLDRALRRRRGGSALPLAVPGGRRFRRRRHRAPAVRSRRLRGLGDVGSSIVAAGVAAGSSDAVTSSAMISGDSKEATARCACRPRPAARRARHGRQRTRAPHGVAA